jgi:hypothetical protein
MAIKSLTLETLSLYQRIRYFYHYLNGNDWEACFHRLDPKLRDGKIEHDVYVQSLTDFFDKYGPIKTESMKFQLYLKVKKNLYDDRPFAYGEVHWQDRKGRTHVFRERWVKTDDKWCTRMAGLV